MTEHTKGPWEVREAGPRSAPFPRIFVGERKLATVERSLDARIKGGSCAEAKANACLIAAAPELLEAASMALASNPLMDGGEHVAIPRKAWDALVEATNKARGAS